MPDIAIPYLPSRDLDATRAFYEAMGFVASADDRTADGFLGMSRNGAHLMFYAYRELAAHANEGGANLLVEDIEAAHRAARRSAGGTVTAIETKPWGALGFDVIDPDGNLIRFTKPGI